MQDEDVVKVSNYKLYINYDWIYIYIYLVKKRYGGGKGIPELYYLQFFGTFIVIILQGGSLGILGTTFTLNCYPPLIGIYLYLFI